MNKMKTKRDNTTFNVNITGVLCIYTCIQTQNSIDTYIYMCVIRNIVNYAYTQLYRCKSIFALNGLVFFSVSVECYWCRATEVCFSVIHIYIWYLPSSSSSFIFFLLVFSLRRVVILFRQCSCV